MKNEKFDIIGIGELIIDIVKDNNNVLCNPGGAPFNVIATCAKYNLKTSYIGSIGQDEYGLIIKDSFKKYHIDESNLVISDKINTVQAIVTLNEEKDRFFEFKKISSFNDSFIYLNNKDINLNTKLFHYGSLCLFNPYSYPLIKKYTNYCISHNIPLALDVNYRETEMDKDEYKKIIKDEIRNVSFLKISYEEAVIITNESEIDKIIKKLRLLTSSYILLSNGNKDTYFSSLDYLVKTDIKKVKAVDTTGAGDILFGTFLYLIIKYDLLNKPINKKEALNILIKSTTNASISTTKYGAIPSIPDIISE